MKTLTKRQFQIAEAYIWLGRKKAVAEELDISVFTVDNTMREVYRKLDIYPEQLVAYYMVSHIGVDYHTSPLTRYRVTYKSTWGLLRSGVIKGVVALLLLAGTTLQIYTMNSDTNLRIRTTRNVRAGRSRNELDFETNTMIF